MAYLAAQGPIGAAGPTSATWTTPFPHALGDRARDKRGNEYLFVQCDTAVAGEGILVNISTNNHVVPLLHTGGILARVGVAQHQLLVDEGGWVQIYGTAFVQGNNSQCTSAVGQAPNSTDLTSVNTITSVSDLDTTNGLLPCPQLNVTSPTGTLGFVFGIGTAAEDTSLTSLVSNTAYGMYNLIQGMYILTAADVSNMPNAYITERWPNVTSPVSAVSNTTGVVTLTSYVSGSTGGHIGGEFVVFLNYPVTTGRFTS